MGKGKTPDDEKNTQDDLKDSVHRIWLAGLGALAAAEEEGSKLFSNSPFAGFVLAIAICAAPLYLLPRLQEDSGPTSGA